MEVVLYILLAAFVVIVAPILALVAFMRVRRLEQERTSTDPAVLGRLYALETRVEELTQKLVGAEGAPTPRPAVERARPTPPPAAVVPPKPQPPAPAIPPIAPPRRATPTPVTPPPQPASAIPAPSQPSVPPPSRRIDWETLIAGRWLNRVGIAAVLIAVAFFLKLAFDNQWIGPAGRVAIGLLSGTVLLVYSQWLLRRGYLYFSEGIAGLGGGVLYLSLFAAWSWYGLIPQAYSFVGMMAVTASLLAIAVGRNSQRMALVGLVGGFVTPQLVSTGRDQQVILFSYLGVLDAGLLGLTWTRRWRSLEWVAFVGTQIYFWGWYERFYEAEKLPRTTAFATLFFVLFAALPILRGRRDGKLANDQFALILANAFLYLVALRSVMWPENRWALTVAVLALAAAHLLVVRALPRGEQGQPSLARVVYSGLALTFASLAIPIRLEGKWITMAWAIEGAVLVWSGLRVKTWLLRTAGLLLLAIAVFRLFAFPIPADTFLWNARFATFAVTIACLAAAAILAWRPDVDLHGEEPQIYAIAAGVANLLLFWSLSMEVWEAFGRMERPLGLTPQEGQYLGLSLLWVAYAAGLLFAGFRLSQAVWRWMGISVLGLAVAHVFLFPVPGEIFLANPRFLTFALAIGCMATAILWARRARENVSAHEQAVYRAMIPLANFTLLWALSHEVWDVFGRAYQTSRAQQMGLSLLWAVYATAMIVIGIRNKSAPLRWQALGLFGVVVGKVFVFDLSFLDRGYRVLSFMVLGVVLLVVSFLYTRRVAREKREGSE